MDQVLLKELRLLKERYSQEGFLILGVFGSAARGDNRPDSDIDLLYEVLPAFTEKYKGWDYFGRLDLIRTEISERLHKPVDLAQQKNLKPLSRASILPEVVHV